MLPAVLCAPAALAPPDIVDGMGGAMPIEPSSSEHAIKRSASALVRNVITGVMRVYVRGMHTVTQANTLWLA
jgi:hypothetical protein